MTKADTSSHGKALDWERVIILETFATCSR
jgi:hypothetical protein